MGMKVNGKFECFLLPLLIIVVFEDLLMSHLRVLHLLLVLSPLLRSSLIHQRNLHQLLLLLLLNLSKEQSRELPDSPRILPKVTSNPLSVKNVQKESDK